MLKRAQGRSLGQLQPWALGALALVLVVWASSGRNQSSESSAPPRRFAGVPSAPAPAPVEAPAPAPASGGLSMGFGGWGLGSARAPEQAPDYNCKRLIWLTGLQAKTADGNDTNYMTSSLHYLRFYASAVLSAKENAPSLLPVLVALNGMPKEYVEWLEAQGGIVIDHEVSFAKSMDGHVDPIMMNLMASYARLDIPAVMERVLAALPAWEARQLARPRPVNASVPTEVDRDYVIWTDPDVLFRSDISTCTLGKPPVLSIGPEFAARAGAPPRPPPIGPASASADRRRPPPCAAR
ncbi:hypothetical protein Rsub_13366 [Raphidocelis subcapitata]|uniref:Uncharacterized protein n=1 Tax=Raphidocelis subcapitata TaxID=307507 RepID=A0A2V0PLJ3_9CHLO|nr:hypothetical protein Rsub_13366 [Raphidocelis subcapitata]|eukprot:GBG00625.1 hypothetical protein Rsub_13366 [Raphidocelis subcapitata]